LNRIFYILLIFIIFNQLLVGQNPNKVISTDTDSLDVLKDTIPVLIDTLEMLTDTSGVLDSNTIFKPTIDPNITISSDSVVDQVVYGSRDSNYMDVVNNQIHLYGNAFVEFQDMKIQGAYLIFDFNTNIAHAFKEVDSLGLYMDRPTFTNPDQEFNYQELKFNFKTQKGIVYDAISKEGEFFLHGNKTKFLSKKKRHSKLR